MSQSTRAALAGLGLALLAGAATPVSLLQAGPSTVGPVATITTDRQDYPPSTQVIVTGSGWQSGETVSMLFHETGQTAGQYTDPDQTFTTVAHDDGTVFFDQFWTDWHDVGITFTVTATGLSSGLVAQASFTDNASANGDQCANGGDVKPYNNCAADANWQNGNLGKSDSHYFEGDSVPYRLGFGGLDTAISHTVTIEWDSETAHIHHALDYLTSYNRTMTLADPCAGLGCSGSPSWYAIPTDPHVQAGEDGTPGNADDITPIAGSFAIWGGTITSVGSYTYDASTGPDTKTAIQITFTASITNPVLAWGGHIATRRDWGLGNSAIAVSGSPYHMRLIELDGKGGNQDMSLDAAAVFFPPELTIIKQTDPDAATSHAFDFTTTGTFADIPGGASTTAPTFTLTPPNGTTAVSRVFYLNDETTRTVTESAPSSPWALSGLTCRQIDGGVGTGTVTTDLTSRTSTIQPKEGEFITCTYTNQVQTGSIKVVKATVPSGSSQSFDFTATGTDFAGSFSLTDAQNHTVGNLLPGTGYAVSETVPAGWAQTSAVCDHGTIGAIEVIANTTTTCTFTNTRQSQLRIEKVTLPDGDTTDFTFTPTNWNSGSTFTRRDNQAAFASGYLAPGASNYDTVETVPSGWALTDRACVLTGTSTTKTFTSLTNGVRVNLAAGEDVTCTFTNTKQSQLRIEKVTLPDGDTTDFTFTPTSWNSGATFTRRDNQAAFASGYLAPGATNYDAVETVPAGWALTNRACVLTGTATSKAFTSLTDGVRVNLGIGEDVTCTFTNTKQAQLHIVKSTLPDGNTTDFTFTPTSWNSGSTFTRRDNQAAFNSGYLTPGATNYDTVETVPTGWALTGRACVLTGTATSKTFTSITDGIRLNLSAGEDVTCTFTNTQQSQLRIEKVTLPDGDTTDFTFTPANWNGGSTFTRRDNQAAFASGYLSPGATNYDTVEAVPIGWALTARACVLTGTSTAKAFTSITNGVRVNLAVGEDVTCTFTDTRLATMIVEKQTDPDGASGSFTFTGTAAGSIGNGGQIIVSGLLPGAYNSTESDPTPNFDLTSILCSDGNSTGNVSTRLASFNLEAGETVKCTFTNRQRGLAKVVKTFNGLTLTGAETFTFQLRSGASASAAGTTLETLTANAANGGVINFTTKLVPGTTYQMCEQMQPGWLTTLGPPLYSVFDPSGDNSIVCTDFTVTAGQTKEFAINNQPPPGGLSLTIGYWKNWASCAASKGKQAPTLDRVVDGRTLTYGSLVLTDTNILEHDIASDCPALVNLLNKMTVDGRRKMASDPIFNMVAQLVAVDLNVLAGAGLSVNGVAAWNQAHALLAAINFSGMGYMKPLSAENVALANCLATALDQSNNNLAVQSCGP